MFRMFFMQSLWAANHIWLCVYNAHVSLNVSSIWLRSIFLCSLIFSIILFLTIYIPIVGHTNFDQHEIAIWHFFVNTWLFYFFTILRTYAFSLFMVYVFFIAIIYFNKFLWMCFWISFFFVRHNFFFAKWFREKCMHT